MITETGKVVAVDDDGLWVETLKQSACSQCAAKKGCGQKLIADYIPDQNMTLVKALFIEGGETKGWQVGDAALLGVKETDLVISALIAYILPLLALVVGAFIGHSLSTQADGLLGSVAFADVFSAIGAIVGLLAGGLISRNLPKFMKNTAGFYPLVLSKLIQ